MKTTSLFFLLLLLALWAWPVASQDIHFSQMTETPLLRNPALAGIFTGDVRVQTVFRSQYNAVANAYKTGSVNVEYKTALGKGDDFITLGAQVLYDRAGTVALTSTHFLPALNYHKSLSKERNMYLSLGLMGGIVQRRVDLAKITTNSQYNGTAYDELADNGERFNKNGYNYFDGSVGMSFNSSFGYEADNNFYLGLGYHHFNKAKQINFYTASKVEMTPKWVGSIGVRMNASEYTYLSFEADYTTQGAYTEVLAGMLYSMKLDAPDDAHYVFHGGAYLRWNDALVPVVKLDVESLAIALSYDVNISQLKAASSGRGGFEVSLTWQKFLDRDNSAQNAVRCPKF